MPQLVFLKNSVDRRQAKVAKIGSLLVSQGLVQELPQFRSRVLLVEKLVKLRHAVSEKALQNEPKGRGIERGRGQQRVDRWKDEKL